LFISLGLGLGLLSCLFGAMRAVEAASAVVITVNTTADELIPDGDCSLREAIQAANTDTPVDACGAGSGADTINLPAGMYTLAMLGANEDINAGGDLDITATLTLNGANAATTIINANSLDRALHLTTGGVTLTLLNLTVRNGNVFGDGGGLLANGPAVVSNTTFISNTADFGGGASFWETATVTGVTFVSNTALVAGGGAYFTKIAVVTGVTFQGNTAGVPGGGAFFNGIAIVTGAIFQGNTADFLGGGAYFNVTATVTGAAFINNAAGVNGGGAYFDGAIGPTLGDFVNTLFAANHAASNQGSGLFARNRSNDDVVTLRHATIASPTIGGGSAVYVVTGTLHVTNTIVASYSIGLARADGVLGEDYNLFSGVATPYSGTVSSGGNSFSGAAAFANATLYKLTAASAARDAGDNAGVTTDFEGDPRPLDAGFDIGWDEAKLSYVYLPLVMK
jgi:CSLREA domain-containing protein